MKKAGINVKDKNIMDLFQPVHLTINVSSKSELSNDMIMDKITSASGSKSRVKS